MARVRLGDLAAKTVERMDSPSTADAPVLTTVPSEPEAPVSPPEAAPDAPTATTAPEPPARPQARTRAAKAKPAVKALRFDELERKEARVRQDQYEGLTALSRQLNRSRNRQGERITENTLIRVAIDLLLERGEDLNGTTEAELRASVGL